MCSWSASSLPDRINHGSAKSDRHPREPRETSCMILSWPEAGLIDFPADNRTPERSLSAGERPITTSWLRSSAPSLTRPAPTPRVACLVGRPSRGLHRNHNLDIGRLPLPAFVGTLRLVETAQRRGKTWLNWSVPAGFGSAFPGYY